MPNFINVGNIAKPVIPSLACNDVPLILILILGHLEWPQSVRVVTAGHPLLTFSIAANSPVASTSPRIPIVATIHLMKNADCIR